VVERSPLNDITGDGPSGVTRRRFLAAVGAAGAAGLAGCAAAQQSTQEINAIEVPAFISDAEGNPPPYDDDTMVFDPGPISIPLDQIMSGNDYDNDPAPVLNDSRQLITKPPADYDGEYDDAWAPMTWGDLAGVEGEVEVGAAAEDGTLVDIQVENAVPNGQYTIWVVKFAELETPDEYDAFVTPRGNGLVGFQNLGVKLGDRTEADNQFRTDGDGNASITRRNEGGPLSGVPGFRPPNYPFVGEADDYVQDADRLARVDDDLTAEDEIHFVGAYHYDDQTWGVYPGPWHLNHFDARFDL